MLSIMLAVVMSVSPQIALFSGSTKVTVTVNLEGYPVDAWKIEWMDGSASSQSSEIIEDFTRTHTYRRAGEYPVTVLLYRNGKVVKALSRMVVLKGMS